MSRSRVAGAFERASVWLRGYAIRWLWVRGRAYCAFFCAGGLVESRLCRVHTDNRREPGVLWRYVRRHGRRYYLDLAGHGVRPYVTIFPPSGSVVVPVAWLAFADDPPRQLDVERLQAEDNG